MRSSFCLYLLVVWAFACSTREPNRSTLSTQPVHPSIINEIFNAHGGYGTWEKFQSLSFRLSKGERNFVNLADRRIRVESGNWTIGFDGNEVWINPSDVDFRDPRFYHNLYFYFVSMPFVLGDPGISYESMPNIVLRDTVYKRLKISYGDGIGDSPKDNYILCYDSVSKEMNWLLYTVTYGEDQPNEDFGLIHYSSWTEIDGLRLPTELSWYKYQSDTVGLRRSTAYISDWQLATESYPDSLFVIPPAARIAPPPE